VRSFQGVRRAISRNGTTAVVLQCQQRFSCGRTLFLNGKEWLDPDSVQYRTVVAADVAPDGRVVVVTREAIVTDSGSDFRVVERWISQSGEVLAERSMAPGPDIPSDVVVLGNGGVALAFTPAEAGPGDYVVFQDADFRPLSTWRAGVERVLTGIRADGNRIVVGGLAASNHPWTGVLDADARAEIWTRTREDIQAYALAVDFAGSGDGVVAALADYATSGTALLLGEAAANPGTLTPVLVPDLPPPSPLPTSIFGNVTDQGNGTILLSTNFAGSYCYE
jgi:hypothetical protein